MPTHPLAMLRRRLRDARQAAVARFRTDHRADALLAALRRAADQALRELLRTHRLPAGAALAAVGGYGRGELYPGSDVDLLILLPAPPDSAQTQTIERLVAALWDVGLEPGHSVRTLDECLHAASAEITVETALLESRWLAGSRTLMRQFHAAMQAQLDARRFFLAKRAEMHARHARYQNTPYALEPHCKESPGGLRDVQVIGWMARAAVSGKSLGNNPGSGPGNHPGTVADLLSADEARALRRAEQVLKRLRIELHLLAGRREDRLLFEWQPTLAHACGVADGMPLRASERLMQRYYRAAQRVTQLNLILVQSLEERLFAETTGKIHTPIDTDFRAVQGRLDINGDDAFTRNPALLLRAFLVMQQHPELTGMSARSLRALWHQRRRIDARFRRDPAHRQLFLRILREPPPVAQTLRHMTVLDVLPRYLPPFRRIVGQMQHNLFHAYTVDQHTLRVIDHLQSFSQPTPHPAQASTLPPALARQLMARFERPWLLTIAALFHDIAKGRDCDHSTLGARAVARFARQHELPRDDAALVTFLVRHHLLMSHVAQKQDISNPAVIHAFARSVASPTRLAALYLLTVADICGTHPTLWNGWKDKLLADLYALTLAALTDRSATDRHAVLARRKQHAARLLRRAGVADATRRALWQRLDAAYFFRHDAADIAWHTLSLHRAAPADTVVRARWLAPHASLQVLVSSPDRPDLFETLCGYFDAHGLDVQDARIHTTDAGWAIDHFVVLARHPGHPGEACDASSPPWPARIEQALTCWLNAPPCPAARSARRRPPSWPSRQSRQFPVTPEIVLQLDTCDASGAAPGARYWQLALTATDQPGLLHAIAHMLRCHGVSLHTAKIMTLGARVENVFTVYGNVLTEPRARRQFEQQLLAALASPAAPPSATLRASPV